jgi:hypothetical protein
MTTAGRQLLGLPPSEWVELHRQRWPSERASFQEAVGVLLSSALRGNLAIEQRELDERGRLCIQLASLEPEQRAALDFVIPGPDEDGNPPTKSVDLQAVLLPAAVRAHRQWVMQHTKPGSYLNLSDVDAVACQLLLAPIMADLAAVLRIRGGAGPSSDKGREEKLAHCRQAHEALGLPAHLIEPLLNPALRRAEVVAAREALLLSWASHPADIGARAMALLCARLAQAYYSKARKDGTVQEARVMNTRTKPLLEATLRDWTALVTYLGEALAAADAAPMAIPTTALPSAPPQAVTERIDVLRRWWQLYDDERAALRGGAGRFPELVPPRWEYANPDAHDRPLMPESYRAWLPVELTEEVERLWGTTILPREPTVLISEAKPFRRFAELLHPAIDVWDELIKTCWSLCIGGWALPLNGLETQQAKARRGLAELETPIDTAVYRDLCDAGDGHPWLFEPAGTVLTLDLGVPTVSAESGRPPNVEASGVFATLASVISRHRCAWVDRYLDRMLATMWRRDAADAAEAYWRRHSGKGSAPTVKQALPDVLEAANRWFNGDYGALAQLTGLEGPISQPPVASNRSVPGDRSKLKSEIAQILRSSALAGAVDDSTLVYRIEELAAKSDEILAYWQATGETPPRSAVISPNYELIFRDVFACDLESGYAVMVAATHQALAGVGHPAATDLEC